VDAIWLSPFFLSPMKDFGYDVSDYCQVDPIFGSIEDFQELVSYAHELDVKVIIDQVWSHTSNEHSWFKKSRLNATNSKADWYVWADAKPDGTPPNNWLSYFGGPAWTWDARRGQYYLHHFLKEQPALNYWNDDVRARIKEVGAFWLDLGVDGFRIDASHTFVYDPKLRNNPVQDLSAGFVPSDVPLSNPMSRQRREHSMCTPYNFDWIKEIRSFVDQWDDRCLLAEAGGDDSEKVAASYVQEGHYHLAYSFGVIGSNMGKEPVERAIKSVEDVIKNGWVCWSTSNHDFKRVVSRVSPHCQDTTDIARFAMALGLTLRGSFCIYQGEELGLNQAEIAFEDLADPYDISLYPEHVGRDGCRTPIPWQENVPHAGFSTTTGKTWLPVCDEHLSSAVDVQETSSESVLNAYRQFLNWRKSHDAARLGKIRCVDSIDDLIVYERYSEDQSILCIFNSSGDKLVWGVPSQYLAYDLDGEISYHCKSSDDGKITLEAYGYGFLVLKK
ncbi:MAG: alpha-amylase family glycosyl hydrolase, partial [Bdellovibrionales bacterium]